MPAGKKEKTDRPSLAGKNTAMPLSQKMFFILYFLVITAVFLFFFFFHGTQITYENHSLGTTNDEDLTLDLQSALQFTYRVSDQDFAGILLNDYYDNDQTFTDEALLVTVKDADTDEILKTITIALADQYTEKQYKTNLYIPAPEDVSVGTKLSYYVKMQDPDGHNREAAILLGLSEEAREPSLTRVSGLVKTGQTIYATACYRRESSQRLKICLIYLAGLVAGLALLYCAGALSLPLTRRGQAVTGALWQEESGASGTESRKGPQTINAGQARHGRVRHILHTCLFLLLIIAAAYVFWDYVYTFSVEKAQNQQDADLNGVMVTDMDTGTVSLSSGDEISQLMTSGEDRLSGVALRFLSSANVYTTGNIRLRLQRSDTGEVLADCTYSLSSLASLADAVPDNLTGEEETAVTKYRWFDFGKTISASKGRVYRLTVSVEGNRREVKLQTYRSSTYPLQKGDSAYAHSLSMIVLYRTRYYLSPLYRFLAIALTILACVLYLMHRKRTVRPETMYLIAALVTGAALSILIPPYCVPDERAHIDMAYLVSNELMGISNEEGPSRILMRACDVNGSVDNTMSVSAEMYGQICTELFEKAGDTLLTPAYVRNVLGNVTSLHYLPAALGFTMARLLGLNTITMIMFGRWMNLLVMVLILYLAARVAPVGRSVFLLFGLLPMVLQMGASCSYDGMIIAAGCLFVSLCLRITFSTREEKESIFDWLGLTASGMLLAASKGGVYAPILLMALAIPFNRTKAERRGKYIFCIIGAAVCSGCVFLSLFAQRLSTMFARTDAARGSSSGSAVSVYALQDFIEEPKKLIRMIQNTIYVKGDTLLEEILGSRLGKLEVGAPWFLLVIVAALLLLAVFQEEKETIRLRRGQRLYYLILCAAGSVLVMISMLIAWTSRSASSIQGLQGRYFLPYVLLFLCACVNRKALRVRMSDQSLVLSMGTVVCILIGNYVLSLLG